MPGVNARFQIAGGIMGKRYRKKAQTAGYRTVLSLSCLLPALLLFSALSGCASMKQEKTTPTPPLLPQKQFSSASTSPYPEPGPQPASLAPTGSLWAPSSGSLFSDLRASKIGDIVTITISEESKASKASATAASREKDFTGTLTFSGLGVGQGVSNPKGALALGPYSGKFTNAFTGTGQTSQTDSMTAYMTATVVDVLPNGNLVIRGSRWTKVNDEMQQIILEGVVRPADISRSNAVLSQNVAEAKIFLLGKGPVSQHQKPGWLGQLLDFVAPF